MSKFRVFLLAVVAVASSLIGPLEAGTVSGWQDFDAKVSKNGSKSDIETMTSYRFVSVLTAPNEPGVQENSADFTSFVPASTKIGNFRFSTDTGVSAGRFGNKKLGFFTGSQVTLLASVPGERSFRVDGTFLPGKLFPATNRSATPSWLDISLFQAGVGKKISVDIRLGSAETIVITAVPEPSTFALLGMAALSLSLVCRTRRTAA